MRMSGLCKVEMSGFIPSGRRDGNGADRVERERTGAVEGAATSGRRASEAGRSSPAATADRSSRASFARAAAQRRRSGIVHRLRGCRSNRKISEAVRQRVVRELGRARYAGFAPTLAAEHLARQGIVVSRETLRSWMSAAELWQTRRRRGKPVHVWRPRRSSFGELVMMDSSPFRWLEERGPACHLIAMIDDATSRVRGRLVKHDSTEENLRTLRGWLERYGRPLALYTDKNSLFVTTRSTQRHEQLQDTPRAHAVRPRAGGTGHRVDRGPFAAGQGTRRAAVRHAARPAGERNASGGNRYAGRGQSLPGNHLLALLEKRFTVRAAQGRDAHRRLEREHRLEQILSVRVERDGGLRSHGGLERPAMGPAARRGLRRTARRSRRNRKAARRHALAALPRPLPAAALLSGSAAIRKSFRPTASRTCGSQTKTPNPNQNPLQPASRSSLA